MHTNSCNILLAHVMQSKIIEYRSLAVTNNYAYGLSIYRYFLWMRLRINVNDDSASVPPPTREHWKSFSNSTFRHCLYRRMLLNYWCIYVRIQAPRLRYVSIKYLVFPVHDLVWLLIAIYTYMQFAVECKSALVLWLKLYSR